MRSKPENLMGMWSGEKRAFIFLRTGEPKLAWKSRVNTRNIVPKKTGLTKTEKLEWGIGENRLER